jgi:hypothetical protein
VRCSDWRATQHRYCHQGSNLDLAEGTRHARPSNPTGNRREYLVARIARDRPDILARMQAGEFSSVWAAARVAGIVRDTRTALKGDAPLVEPIKRLWAKASPDEQQAIRDYLAREGHT